MNPTKIILGFVPLVLFSVAGHILPIGWAAGLGLAAAVALVAATARGGIKTLPVVQTVIMAAILAAAILGGTGIDSFLTTNARGAASLLLGAFILATAAIRPFTIDFAKETVPPEFWHSEKFLTVNRRISQAWGGAVVALGICHLAAAHLHPVLTLPLATAAINWLIPILAVVWAVKFTQRTIAEQRTPNAVTR